MLYGTEVIFAEPREKYEHFQVESYFGKSKQTEGTYLVCGKCLRNSE